ncbi:MAG TPA: thiamine pyrophosphate-dependent enzyme, partial [Saprospiraceae bacterium]|nr:thiamine pyrophosphate-dependent enzyme [Saprospiraceae bacterium]
MPHTDPVTTMPSLNGKSKPQHDTYRQQVLADYRICALSREASHIARQAVLNGRANFGIIGDGKEVAQVAMARAWRKGDFRSGYYRDQTLMMALGLTTLDEFFAQLYGDPYGDPFSGGRQMNCHFATPLIGEDGAYLDLKNRYNVSADIAPTGGQMARGLGLAFASKKFRENPALCADLSDQGNEVTFVTIGDASTSEGAFWETINAAGVLQVPLAVSVWDDGYGISVPKKYQTTKESISEVLEGFRAHKGDGTGIDIHVGKAWDYAGLCELYSLGIASMRSSHRPALFHIQEVTQQLGHSTSGDHRRYKSPERLEFEENFDCNRRMAEWMVSAGLATQEEIDRIKAEAKKEANEAAQRAYRAYHDKVALLKNELSALLADVQAASPGDAGLQQVVADFSQKREPLRFKLLEVARRALYCCGQQQNAAVQALHQFVQREQAEGRHLYSAHLLSETPRSPMRVKAEPARYETDALPIDAYKVLNACFDHHLQHNPALFAFGEDVGQIGDVNQGMQGMQQKHGIERVFDV